MGLIDSFLNRITKKNLQATNELYNRAIYNYLGEKVIWNPENDETFIDQGYRANPTVYALINIITKAASTIPLCVYEYKSENELKRYKSVTSGFQTPESIRKAEYIRKASFVEIEDTDLHELLDRPNPAQSYNAFLTDCLAFSLLTGNSYIYGIDLETGEGAGKFKELYVLPSHKMQIESGGIMQPVKEYTLEYNGMYKIPANNICHLKTFNPYYDGTGSHLYGMSPLKAGLRVLQSNNEAVTTGVKYLQNQTARGVLISDEGDLSEVQAQQLKEKFKEQTRNINNRGDIMLSSKKLSWINFGLSAADLSLIEQYNLSVKDLCNIYNVPVQLLNNTESATYNNMKEAKKALYQNAVIPELCKFRDEFNRWASSRFGEKIFVDFDYSAISELQEETDKIVDQMEKSWWLTPNEKRSATSYPVDEENDSMNRYYIPANYIPILAESEENIEMDKSFVLKDLEIEEKAISARIKRILQDKVEEHNEKYGDDAGKRATYGMLAASFRRGVGAYNTNPSSVRPSVSNSDQWALARVNGLLYALRTGKFKRKPYDTDLLPSAHPLSSKKSDNLLYDIEDFDDLELKEESFNSYPQGATNNAKRMLEWRDKYGRDEVRGGTAVGWQRANQLANREKLTISTIKRVHSFLSRHAGNEVIAEQYRDTPWKDAGYVSYNLWGGKAMKAWAERMAEKYS